MASTRSTGSVDALNVAMAARSCSVRFSVAAGEPVPEVNGVAGLSPRLATALMPPPTFPRQGVARNQPYIGALGYQARGPKGPASLASRLKRSIGSRCRAGGGPHPAIRRPALGWKNPTVIQVIQGDSSWHWENATETPKKYRQGLTKIVRFSAAALLRRVARPIAWPSA